MVFNQLSEEDKRNLECLDCVFKDMSLTDITRINCESFENIHLTRQRRELLLYLCKTVLGKYVDRLGEKSHTLIERFITDN